MSVRSVIQLKFAVCLIGSGDVIYFLMGQSAEQTKAGLVPVASTLLPQCHRLVWAADGACGPPSTMPRLAQARSVIIR